MGLKHATSQFVHWRSELLDLLHQPSIGVVLVACSQLMLEYWEARYPRDDKMAELVSAMVEWVRVDSPESRRRVFDLMKRVAVEVDTSGYLSPAWELPYRYEFPGDHAGDAIVAAANAISELEGDNFESCARVCLKQTVRAVAEKMGHRSPEDDVTDFESRASEEVRLEVVQRLREWNWIRN